ncbi:MAG: hypothetical protein R2711_18085 [Acidimicrobiales bacterium]
MSFSVTTPDADEDDRLFAESCTRAAPLRRRGRRRRPRPRRPAPGSGGAHCAAARCTASTPQGPTCARPWRTWPPTTTASGVGSDGPTSGSPRRTTSAPPAYPSDLDDLALLSSHDRAVLYLADVERLPLAEVGRIPPARPPPTPAPGRRARRRLARTLAQGADR